MPTTPTTANDGFAPPQAAPTQRRISRACLRCRQRKSKCNLNDTSNAQGVPPCQRCVRDGGECILGGSNRGGKRIRKSKPVQDSLDVSSTQASHVETTAGHSNLFEQNFAGLTPTSGGSLDQQRRAASTSNISMVIEDTFASTNLHNTSDALNFLSQAAENAAAAQMSGIAASRPGGMTHGSFQPRLNQEPAFQSRMGTVLDRQILGSQHADGMNVIPYHLITMGWLTQDQVVELLCRFAKLYHPYLPIAPKRSLQPAFLAETAQYEPHLLTAMITVAAKDLPGGTDLLDICSKYMHQLVSEISAGKRCDVEAVEALLLLAEWEPQSTLTNVKEIGCGEEDLAAWMHVGLALRIGYYLRLDRTSFKNDDEERMLQYNRRRLAWAACYVSDRQISVRIGRAFWSRGPGPVSATGRHPTLQPDSPADDDLASIFQATIELTQLFSNVHDVLYSGMGSSMKMMLVGNYVKYIDDFRAAINSWKSIWGTLTCSQNLKITIQMTYEYLRLYNSAYAFQATTFRAISSKNKRVIGQEESAIGHVGSLPDARFIYESVDAAKSLLTLVNNFSHPESSLRHFPMRFTLYCVNSAVFLYKAWSLGILGPQEKIGVRRMITDTIARLRGGSVRQGDFGSRYAQLLELLWRQTDEEEANHGGESTRPSMADPPPNLMVGKPLNSLQEEFSWLDLQAVGEFLTGEQDPMDFDFSADNLQQFVQASRRGSVDWNDLGWPDNDVNRFF